MSSRKVNDIPFPSFSLVINQYSMSNMRLPSYRASYLLRFHPYPRVKLSQREIMHAVNDSPSSLYDIVENDDSVGPVILNFPDLPEEQHPNAENPQEAIEVAETDAQPHVKHLNFATLIIDLAILVARKLSWKTK
ncbi:uncharacterized protein F5891DRAFT_753403 [Suillus fuscotomentosus]|uniref:Uncharacterized protein n=1 Tax=Suillus fuscotomentosus TaxID=1912939 RepID=A0AAD4EEG2_9AGAM|nr:uncharacterized protein F5891DRAFT_753403 [Suillus fuscotomentosus]KAG1904656.1 hypothetical protein F5891DRAFT_753403 [Suillus fuscotomentosus]